MSVTGTIVNLLLSLSNHLITRKDIILIFFHFFVTLDVIGRKKNKFAFTFLSPLLRTVHLGTIWDFLQRYIPKFTHPSGSQKVQTADSAAQDSNLGDGKSQHPERDKSKTEPS